MEEFRTLIADTLSRTIAADKLSKKAFREIEEAFVTNADILFQAKQKEYYRADIIQYLEDNYPDAYREVTPNTLEEMLIRLITKYDCDKSHWDNIESAIEYIFDY